MPPPVVEACDVPDGLAGGLPDGPPVEELAMIVTCPEPSAPLPVDEACVDCPLPVVIVPVVAGVVLVVFEQPH